MKVVFPKIRIAFPSLWEARAAEPGGKEKYSASFLYEEGDDTHEKIKATISAILTDKHGEKAAAVYKKYLAGGKVYPMRDGDEKADKYAGFEGMMFFAANSEVRPKVRDKDGITDLAPSDGVVYAGCYVRAIIDIYEYKEGARWSAGITAQLLGVQFVADGERLSGGGVAEEDDFEAVPEADATTAGATASTAGAGGIFD